MSWEKLPCKEERMRKNLWTTFCFIKFLYSNRFPEFMYVTSCAQAFRKRSLSLMGPSPLLRPAKHHQVRSQLRETAENNHNSLPLGESTHFAKWLCGSSHQEVETFPFSDPWFWPGFMTCYDQQNAVDGISVLALSLDLQRPCLVLYALLGPWPLPCD